MAYGVVVGQSSDFPIGGIIIWSGASTAIPSGWHLCDGTNGTPNLRDRFIVGAGNEYKVGDTGGSKQVTLAVEQMPKHTHTGGSGTVSTSSDQGRWVRRASSGLNVQMPYWDSKMDGSVTHTGFNLTNMTTDIYHTHTLDLSTINLGKTGGSQPHENRPPYYALCYIMKIK